MLNSREIKIYKNIDFIRRYEALSTNFQIDDELNYSKEEVVSIIKALGYDVKFMKKNNFFKIEQKIDGIKFYFHICLKYSLVELIVGALYNENNIFITGDVFGGLYKDMQPLQGVELGKGINKPSFSSYSELTEILKEAFSIYEDFKTEVIKEYGE
ncbi:hypothetical protein [Flavobacterium sp. JP2137]|uniref:hypothetical protein n=1 Tax=Flavobacterium sp. JP2137 TaxID=3414510 RepID=UPI003D2FF4FA